MILDLYSRRVVGWAISFKIDTELCLTALDDEIEERSPEPGLIHHSDRAVQYACNAYKDRLAEYEPLEDVLKGNPRFIESVYNEKRLRSSLGYFSPEEFEKLAERKQLQKKGASASHDTARKSLQRNGCTPVLLKWSEKR